MKTRDGFNNKKGKLSFNGNRCALAGKRVKPHIYFLDGEWHVKRGRACYMLNGDAIRHCALLNRKLRGLR